MSDFHDIPWGELLVKADEAIRHGATLYQKFTCESCGSRQTMDTPNVFHERGGCEDCRHVTDLRKVGGGFLATFGIGQNELC